MDALVEGGHKTSCMRGSGSKYLASLIGEGSGFFQDSSEGNSLGIWKCSDAEQPKEWPVLRDAFLWNPSLLSFLP